jgi:uncharacterized Zn finger protein
MECPRCSGEMAYEVFQDMQDDTGNLCFYGWRCIICGEILDPVIVSNRKSRPAPLINKNKKYIVSSKKLAAHTYSE